MELAGMWSTVVTGFFLGLGFIAAKEAWALVVVVVASMVAEAAKS